ncbi:uncharacterized protein LOC129806692 [Phlebotomus papatasi]|uniref:uncharacterized protein LOC129806692 n=1 Tax=Phlebotomus papatasi TaxID=29031 RepID=UPI0024842900|nr:uncharacterized protein LOC129806692 [Phlebotomus papatasi]
MKKKAEQINKRKSRKWQLDEKMTLFNLIVENQRGKISKNMPWHKIHQRFTKIFGAERTLLTLKQQFRKMKTKAKTEIKKFSDDIHFYGVEVANRSRPSDFSIEIWKFISESEEHFNATEAMEVDRDMKFMIYDDSDKENLDPDKIRIQRHKDDDPLNEFNNKLNAQGNIEAPADPDNTTQSITVTDMVTLSKGIQTENSNFDMKEFYEMQLREHKLRMDILELQFETFKAIDRAIKEQISNMGLMSTN